MVRLRHDGCTGKCKANSKIKECKACLFLCVFFSLLLCDDEPCSEPSLEIRCVRDAVRDMSLELCPGNVNEGDCRQQRNSRQRTNKGEKHTKEREEHAQLDATESRDTHSTAGAKRSRQKSSRTDKKRDGE